MSCGPYVPAIKAEFGRTITNKEIDNEFQRIEEVLECICNEAGNNAVLIENAIDLGNVTDSVTIEPSGGIIQYLTVEGDVEITVEEPEDTEPNLITLVIADGGSGRFNFPLGVAWTSDANGTGMDGKPWDNGGLGGDYGALVTCIYDGEGWIFIVFARHDIDPNDVADVADLYNWR